MVFSSLLFVYLFLPLSLLVYFLCDTLQAKNRSLLIFSLIFYAWGEPKYVLLLMLMALIDWACALGIARSERPLGRRLLLALATVADLALIGFFKYSAMLCALFGDVPEWIAQIALPIGISFYTFQLLTYVIDVYRGEAPAQARYENVLLYAALFHQCIAGPIVRYQTVARELFVGRDSGDVLSGIRRFSLGLAKKALLANPCGELADSLLLTTSTASDLSLLEENLASLQSLPALSVWVGMIAFMLQIYLDFSAYSDMAIGLGRMIGLHYPENFRHPYASRSVTEFWRRWHISLGSFFRDYVYIPLGGNRGGTLRTMFNLFVVWALTGLWHGASWNFVLWGLYFFVLLAIEKAGLLKVLKKSHVFSHVYLLLAVFFGWILFHFTVPQLSEVVFRGLFGGNGNGWSDFLSVTVLQNHAFLLLFAALACTPFWELGYGKLAAVTGKSRFFSGAFTVAINCVLPVAFLLLSTCALVGDSYNPFIYFQF